MPRPRTDRARPAALQTLFARRRHRGAHRHVFLRQEHPRARILSNTNARRMRIGAPNCARCPPSTQVHHDRERILNPDRTLLRAPLTKRRKARRRAPASSWPMRERPSAVQDVAGGMAIAGRLRRDAGARASGTSSTRGKMVHCQGAARFVARPLGSSASSNLNQRSLVPTLKRACFRRENFSHTGRFGDPLRR